MFYIGGSTRDAQECVLRNVQRRPVLTQQPRPRRSRRSQRGTSARPAVRWGCPRSCAPRPCRQSPHQTPRAAHRASPWESCTGRIVSRSCWGLHTQTVSHLLPDPHTHACRPRRPAGRTAARHRPGGGHDLLAVADPARTSARWCENMTQPAGGSPEHTLRACTPETKQPSR